MMTIKKLPFWDFMLNYSNTGTYIIPIYQGPMEATSRLVILSN